MGFFSATTATVTSVAASVSAVTLLASAAGSAAARTIVNDSSAPLYVKFGSGASTTSYTVQVPAGGYFEFPDHPLYAGQVTGVWSAAVGAARCTEVS